MKQEKDMQEESRVFSSRCVSMERGPVGKLLGIKNMRGTHRK